MIHKCCCCIPLRAGVFIIALLSGLASVVSLIGLIIDKTHVSQYASTYIDETKISTFYYVGIGIVCVEIIACLFGLIGTTMQKRGLVNVFNIFYWIMAIICLIVTLAIWIFFLVKRSDIQSACTEYLNQSQQIDSSYGLKASPADACESTMKAFLIGGGFAVFIGNFISIYFACVINAYTNRLKSGFQHQQLRDLEDFPQPYNKASLY